MVKLIQPQEVEVFYVIPAIRRELAVALKQKGLSQKECAKLLGVTEAAISQYMSKKRAKEIKFSKEIKKEIKKSAGIISKKKTHQALVQQIQKLLKKMRLITCGICKKIIPARKKCTVCFGK